MVALVCLAAFCVHVACASLAQRTEPEGTLPDPMSTKIGTRKSFRFVRIAPLKSCPKGILA